MSTPQELAEEYQKNFDRADRLRAAIADQLLRIIQENEITLGVPIESRVKSLLSITEKVERKELAVASIFEFDDVIGLRVILLFNRDVELVNSLIEKTFEVISSEDTAKRLSEVQFGYQSQHYVAKLPKEWLGVPTFAGLGDLRAELQVRTLAQHMWAAASHKLQYKQEASVPPPLRRAIHRVSALLETVDLEFERVLSTRTEYIKQDLRLDEPDQILNVDILEAVLDELLPAENKSATESYADLLEQLIVLKIDTVDKLRSLLTKQMKGVAKFDANQVEKRSSEGNYKGSSKQRIDKGVFLTQVGWTRRSLKLELGEEAISKVFRRTTPTKTASATALAKTPKRN